MALFQKKIGPVFLKETSDAEEFIQRMTTLSTRAEGQLKQDIEREIKLASYGLIGEKNIAFELKHSDMDMYILHDLYFEANGKTAQIDYILVTRKAVYIIECKNLIGNIEIDNAGNFVRSYELQGKRVKEGIYSPVTQNERHMLVIKELCAPDNLLLKHVFLKFFEENYQSLVVLANPKTYLNARYAKKEVKEQVIRADQLIACIRAQNASSRTPESSNDEMLRIAEGFLKRNIPERSDYCRKYEEAVRELEESTKKQTSFECPAETILPTKCSVAANGVVATDDGAIDTMKKICPNCGGKLVLRTARKGDNAGKQFYGCGNFPKCRYIKNL